MAYPETPGTPDRSKTGFTNFEHPEGGEHEEEIAGQIGQLAPMDEETADRFQQLAKKLIRQIK